VTCPENKVATLPLPINKKREKPWIPILTCLVLTCPHERYHPLS
jgi:hypothetical protein